MAPPPRDVLIITVVICRKNNLLQNDFHVFPKSITFRFQIFFITYHTLAVVFINAVSELIERVFRGNVPGGTCVLIPNRYDLNVRRCIIKNLKKGRRSTFGGSPRVLPFIHVTYTHAPARFSSRLFALVVNLTKRERER